MRLIRILIPVLISGLLATSCSFARLGLDALPYYANWQLDSYLSLDSDQKAFAEQSIDELLAWHQRTQLPKYASFLREVDARILKSHETTDGQQAQAPLRGVDFDGWRDRVEAAWQPVIEQVAGPMAELLGGLKPEQVSRLRSKMEQANKDFRKKYRLDSPEGTRKARGDRAVERTEFLLGDLSRQDARTLREEVAALPQDEQVLYAEREARQRGLLSLIERLQTEKPAQADAERWTRDYLGAMFQSSDPQRRAVFDRNRLATDELMAEVVVRATPEQVRHLSRLLKDFAQDFDRRAAKKAG